jgi:acetoin utilization deacetylase AcuC-like enzyme
LIPTGYLYHPDLLRHEMGKGHAEQPDRVRIIDQALAARGLLDQMVRLEPIPAGIDELLPVHDSRYLQWLESSQPVRGAYQQIDPDTAMNTHSWQAALLAAGAGIMAVDRIMAGDIRRAFCNVRPPGHHAERARCMGFCFINNVAVAATRALERHGLLRVAIVDFDVHHGNGTEDIFADDPRVLLCSTFQSPLYPYRGENTVSDHMRNLQNCRLASGVSKY